LVVFLKHRGFHGVGGSRICTAKLSHKFNMPKHESLKSRLLSISKKTEERNDTGGGGPGTNFRRVRNALLLLTTSLAEHLLFATTKIEAGPSGLTGKLANQRDSIYAL
jgi:hypothetical protein